MKSINLKLVVLWILVSYSLSQDTTYVDLPTAYVHFNYQNSTYGIGLGDESSLQLISGPAWTEVNFNLDTGNWLTYVDISGEPGLVHAGLNELMVGWYEWNFDTDEQELWHVYVFTLPVEYPGCSDPESCNFDPGMPEVENCLYIVYCFIDPCEVTACDYYPDAECVSDYCGGCYADFYVDGELVDCAVEPMEDIFLTWEYPDTVVTGSSANLMVLSLENSMAVGGLQFHVNIDPLDAVMITQIDPTERLGQLPVIWNYDESAGYYSLNVFDMINYIPPGEGAILEFYFDTVISDGFFEVTISEMNAGDYPNGDSLSVSLPDPPFIYIDPCLPGDVNGDTELNILDIVMTVNCIVDNTGECSCSDMNSDGSVDILDIVLMVNIIISNTLPEDCLLIPDIGPCDGVCPRYFYNPDTEQCEMFIWGCCDGVVPFETLEECEGLCE